MRDSAPFGTWKSPGILLLGAGLNSAAVFGTEPREIEWIPGDLLFATFRRNRLQMITRLVPVKLGFFRGNRSCLRLSGD